MNALRRTALALLAVLAVVAPDAAVAAPQSKVAIAWKGKKLDAAALPKDLGAAPASAIALFEPWARSAEYRMDLDPAGRVLVLSPATGGAGARVLPVVAQGTKWFDGLLPKPPPRTGASESAPVEAPSDAPDVIPEDPEGPPPGAEKKGPAKKSPSSWGSGSVQPDSQTATLIALADEEDLASVIDFLVATKPELAAWATEAKSQLGFVLEIPLVAAYVESASGQEEWNPEHEVLNRVVRLLSLRRFGQLPNWLVHAIAWEAEHDLDASIWVYPYRDEFVYTVEHSAWPTDLANEFQGRAGSPLRIDELAGWKSRTWDGQAARHAFGFFHFLSASKKSAIPDLLEDLRLYRDANNRKPAPDGTWTRDPSWEPPAAAQASILEARFGAKVFEEASAWLAKGAGARARADSRRR